MRQAKVGVVTVAVGLALAAATGCGGAAVESTPSADTSSPSDMPVVPPSSGATVIPATAAPTAPPAPATISGDGQKTTDPFSLGAGDYKVHYKFGGDCSYFATLDSTDKSVEKFDFATGSAATEGDTNIYGLEANLYYIDMNTGPPPACPWTITFTRL